MNMDFDKQFRSTTRIVKAGIVFVILFWLAFIVGVVWLAKVLLAHFGVI